MKRFCMIYDHWIVGHPPADELMPDEYEVDKENHRYREVIGEGIIHKLAPYPESSCCVIVEMPDGSLAEYPIENVRLIKKDISIPSDADIIADTIHNSMVTVVGMFQNFMAFQLLLALNQLRAVNMDESLIRQARDLIDRLTTIMSGMDDDEDDEPDILRDLGLKD